MDDETKILGLFRKVICSLLCISTETKKTSLQEKANKYLYQFLNQYKVYFNKKTYSLTNLNEIIMFCNECYEDKDTFDFAEDVEYGIQELIELAADKEEK